MEFSQALWTPPRSIKQYGKVNSFQSNSSSPDVMKSMKKTNQRQRLSDQYFATTVRFPQTEASSQINALSEAATPRPTITTSIINESTTYKSKPYRTSRYGWIPELWDLTTTEESSEASYRHQILEERKKLRYAGTRLPVSNISISSEAEKIQSLESSLQDSVIPNDSQNSDQLLLSQWGLLLTSLKLESSSVTNNLQFETLVPPLKNQLLPVIESPSGTKKPSVFERLSKDVKAAAEAYHLQSVEHAERETQELRRKEQKIREKEERRAEAERKEEERQKQQKKIEEQAAIERKKQVEAEKKKAEKEEKEEKAKIDAIKKTKEIVIASNEDALYIQEQIQARNRWKSYLDSEFHHIKLDNRPQVKAFRVESKKAINLAINQLASTSEQVEHISLRILDLLKKHSKSEAAVFRYVVASVVISLLENVEIQLGSNSKSVWSYGMLLSRLCEISAFQESLESAVKFRCIYCIPIYVTKTKQMSPQEFASFRGQRKEETELMYFQRMSSYLRLWLVFLICRKDRNKYWSWWARFLSAKPKRISSFLLSTGLEVSGFFGLHFFPKQFPKLLCSVVIPNFLPKLKQLQSKDPEGVLTASITQTIILLEDFRKKGRFEVPEGFHMKRQAEDLRDNI